MPDTMARVRLPTGATVRLSDERWAHIVAAHDYMEWLLDLVKDTLSDPDEIVAATDQECYALRSAGVTPIGPKTCVVVFVDRGDPFVVTALLTSRPEQFRKRGVRIWPR